MELHRLLKRQLKRASIDLTDESSFTREQLEDLLNRITQSYLDFEHGRYTIERSLMISSQELKDLNASLKQERDILQAVMSDGYCLFDKHGVLKVMNPVAKELLRLSPIDCQNISFDEAVKITLDDGKEKQLTFKDITYKIQHGDPYINNEGMINHGTGREHPIEFSINPIIADGKLEAVVMLFRDIATRKEHEANLKASRDAAEKSNQAKSLFITNMSHELRTPLNGVIGMSEILSETALNGQQREYVNLILQSGKILLNVVNDVLDFGKIEANKVVIEHADFKLSDLVEEVILFFAERAQARGLELDFYINPSVPESLVGDKHRIYQLLSNLVNNALKFTETGYVKLIINQLPNDDGDIVLKFAVEDTGIGISKYDQKRIFNSFEQGDLSSTKKFEGSGLGLSICKRLVTLMGGQINVESELGKGSSFWFVIPLGRSNLTSSDIYTAHDRSNTHVLLVTSNPNNTCLSGKITDWGCELDTVASVGDIFKSYDDTSISLYDLILIGELKNIDEVNKAVTELTEHYSGRIAVLLPRTPYNYDEERRCCINQGLESNFAGL